MNGVVGWRNEVTESEKRGDPTGSRGEITTTARCSFCRKWFAYPHQPILAPVLNSREKRRGPHSHNFSKIGPSMAQSTSRLLSPTSGSHPRTVQAQKYTPKTRRNTKLKIYPHCWKLPSLFHSQPQCAIHPFHRSAKTLSLRLQFLPSTLSTSGAAVSPRLGFLVILTSSLRWRRLLQRVNNHRTY